MSNRDLDARYEHPAQAIPWMIEQWCRQNIHTCVPGMVDAYDPATKRARVQPGLRALLTDGTTMDRPIIVDVPLRQPAMGGHMLHHQIDKGDVVLLLFAQRGVEQFKERWGEINDPEKGAYFEMRDAFAVPWGTEDIAPVANDGIVMQSEDGQTYIHVVDGRITLHVNGSSITITASDILASAPHIGLNDDR